MEHGYSILMGIFSVALLIYAAAMYITKDYSMLPFRAQVSVTPKDPELYTMKLAKVIALVALAPALSAVVGLWSSILALIVLIVGTAVFIWYGTKLMQDVG